MKLQLAQRDVPDLGVDPFTGGASVSIPIPVTPGRNGFAPALALVHQSGTIEQLGAAKVAGTVLVE